MAAGRRGTATAAAPPVGALTTGVLIVLSAGVGVLAGLLTSDVIIGVAAGAASYVVANSIVKGWAARGGQRHSHR